MEKIMPQVFILPVAFSASALKAERAFRILTIVPEEVFRFNAL
jgi:hypothetical protein